MKFEIEFKFWQLVLISLGFLTYFFSLFGIGHLWLKAIRTAKVGRLRAVCNAGRDAGDFISFGIYKATFDRDILKYGSGLPEHAHYKPIYIEVMDGYSYDRQKDNLIDQHAMLVIKEAFEYGESDMMIRDKTGFLKEKIISENTVAFNLYNRDKTNCSGGICIPLGKSKSGYELFTIWIEVSKSSRTDIVVLADIKQRIAPMAAKELSIDYQPFVSF